MGYQSFDLEKIPSNIAVGAERQSDKEFIYLINVAKGSAVELRTQLYIGLETEIVTKDIFMPMIEELK